MQTPDLRRRTSNLYTSQTGKHSRSRWFRKKCRDQGLRAPRNEAYLQEVEKRHERGADKAKFGEKAQFMCDK